MGRVQKFKMHIYLSENDVLKETDQKYAKYVNVPYTRLQDFEAIYLLLFLNVLLPSFFESLLMYKKYLQTLCRKVTYYT